MFCKDLNMPLWKDIEVKAAKLGVTVEQGPCFFWGMAGTTQNGRTNSGQVISDRIKKSGQTDVDNFDQSCFWFEVKS